MIVIIHSAGTVSQIPSTTRITTARDGFRAVV
jgi:hypothetical protein